MSHEQSINQPNLLPVDRLVQDCTNTSEYLTTIICKIAFSPCSQYLAIPKQDIYGQYCVIVIHCSDWHAQILNDKNFSQYRHFICTSAIWSLAFGQRRFDQSQTNEASNLFDKHRFLIPPTRRELLGRRRSSLSVNRRHDFTRDLFLAAGLADGKINIWNIRTGELTLVLTDHNSTVCGLDFTSYTMQLASCSHDTTIKLWDLLDDGNMYKTLSEWTHVIYAVKWSPDETLLCAVGPYGLVVLFDTTTWTELYEFAEHLHSVVDCAFSSDSALLATASYDTSVILWSTITGEMIKKYAHQIPAPSRIYAGGDNGAFIRSIAITKNNQFLVTACEDNKVRWFPLMSNRSSRSVFERTEMNILSIALTSDGRTMAIGNRNSEVHLLSTYANFQASQVSSLRYLCRLIINSSCGLKRQEILHLPLSQNLINYLLYKDIKTK